MAEVSRQVTVLVSILHNEHDTRDPYTVRYSYIDPASQVPVTNSLACILNAKAPYDVLFSLDYCSSSCGWTFVSATPKPGNNAPAYSIAPNALSLTTSDMTPPGSQQDYRFDLHFFNVRTNTPWVDDPQENNVPQPKPGDGDS